MNSAIVESYLECLVSGDLQGAPLSEDIEFTEPIAGTGKGRESYAAFLSGFLPAILSIEIVQHISEGERIATHFVVESAFGSIPVVGIYRIVDGLIIETTSFYDPRPVLGR